MPQVTVERDGAVAICTITNPPMGYMDRETVPELDAAMRDLEADAGVRAIVLTGGVPGVFVRHYSVFELEALSEQLRTAKTVVDLDHHVPEREIDVLFRRIETMGKPVIAAINGTAMGGGFELALACDIRIATQGEYFLGLPEVNIGILPGAGGTQKLARLVGTARALEMTLRGRTVSADEALNLGMVHEAAPEGWCLPRAMQVAEELAAKPPAALAHIKRLVRNATATPLDEGLALERTLFLDLLISDDAAGLMRQMNLGKRDIRDR
ncbi:MAG: enoyl-CoA hydratase/isomerase family protein [Tepidiformaceae bacterium]